MSLAFIIYLSVDHHGDTDLWRTGSHSEPELISRESWRRVLLVLGKVITAICMSFKWRVDNESDYCGVFIIQSWQWSVVPRGKGTASLLVCRSYRGDICNLLNWGWTFPISLLLSCYWTEKLKWVSWNKFRIRRGGRELDGLGYFWCIKKK